MAAWTGQVVAWIVLFAALAVLAVAVLIPRAFGATPYAVNGSSMEPTLRRADLIVVRPGDVSELGIGSVITYQLESGEPTVATHRIVAVAFQNGERTFQTRGDGNNATDLEWVRPMQIKGELWYRVPRLGHLHSALTGGERQLLVTAVAGGLLAYSATMFVGAWRARGRQPEPTAEGLPA